MLNPTPFQLTSTLILFFATVHMFCTPWLYRRSLAYAKKKEESAKHWKHYHFLSEIYFLISEVEVVFGIWLIPLLAFFSWFEGWRPALAYLNSRDYGHALYIMVVLVVIGSRPIITLAELVLEWFARLGKDTPAAWWWTILIVGPLLGSFIKEPAAMVLSAILLTRKFYPFKPSPLFQYATLGLLFANISVGGMLTNFASRALFIVADHWNWDMLYMLKNFGWKAVVAIISATAVYYLIFRKEFARFPKKLETVEKEESYQPAPIWITIVHLFFLAGIVLTSETPALFIGIFILFLGFWRATLFYQKRLHLQSAILVGFFFAGLIIHGELQSWWVVPIIQKLSNIGVMEASFILSSVMDNAIVGYLTVQIPQIDDLKHYLIISGAMAAGGLTLVANAPNPLGYSILRASFDERLSFLYLFLGALFPSLLFLGIFWVFR